jgi:hypothetical protein
MSYIVILMSFQTIYSINYGVTLVISGYGIMHFLLHRLLMHLNI